jgi:hypothetical protein
MASVSHNSLSVVTTCKHASSVLSSTYPQFTSEDGEHRDPDRSSPATQNPRHLGARDCMPEHTGTGSMYHQVTLQTFDIIAWLRVCPVYPKADKA